MKRYLGLALVAVSASVVALLAAAGSADATTGPAITIYSTAPDHGVVRGSNDLLQASGLQPNSSYTLQSDQLTFTSNRSHSLTFSTGQSSAINVSILLPSTDPSTEVSVTMTAAGDSTVLASLDLPVAHPYLTLNRVGSACPGHATQILGHSFVAGSYLLQSDSATTSSTPVQAADGVNSFIAIITLGNVVDFSVSATAAGDSTPTATQALQATAGRFTLETAPDPWHIELDADCFIAGEQVNLSSAAGLSLPAAATVNQFGGFAVTAVNRPDPQITQPITVTAVGQTSGQQAVVQAEVAQATLLPGQLLRDRGYDHVLASSTQGYDFEPNNCAGPIWHWQTNGAEVSWSALPITTQTTSFDGCSLLMQTDGNAVLQSQAGAPIWSTGTHVAGSHLLLTDSGSLQIISPGGAVLWNSSIAPSRVSIASSRYRSAVYINGLAQQRAPTSQLVRGSYRTVYLQRYLDGHWQNMLARTLDSQGQMAVGFIQPTVYQYRLVLLPAADATGATSGSTFR